MTFSLVTYETEKHYHAYECSPCHTVFLWVYLNDKIALLSFQKSPNVSSVVDC